MPNRDSAVSQGSGVNKNRQTTKGRMGPQESPPEGCQPNPIVGLGPEPSPPQQPSSVGRMEGGAGDAEGGNNSKTRSYAVHSQEVAGPGKPRMQPPTDGGARGLVA